MAPTNYQELKTAFAYVEFKPVRINKGEYMRNPEKTVTSFMKLCDQTITENVDDQKRAKKAMRPYLNTLFKIYKELL